MGVPRLPRCVGTLYVGQLYLPTMYTVYPSADRTFCLESCKLNSEKSPRRSEVRKNQFRPGVLSLCWTPAGRLAGPVASSYQKAHALPLYPLMSFLFHLTIQSSIAAKHVIWVLIDNVPGSFKVKDEPPALVPPTIIVPFGLRLTYTITK
ncbi:hypothetical protein LZ30DRAFT_85709 [Colletotrichum cereale]|nr:hypothetical protein LZ30DRAFT_85709 [Colletotrichum cereale]